MHLSGASRAACGATVLVKSIAGTEALRTEWKPNSGVNCAPDSELTSCRGICISGINKKSLWLFSDSHYVLFFTSCLYHPVLMLLTLVLPLVAFQNTMSSLITGLRCLLKFKITHLVRVYLWIDNLLDNCCYGKCLLTMLCLLSCYLPPSLHRHL